MAILNRNWAIRLVAVGSFLSNMVYSTDHNLVLFYIEQHLGVREGDIASMFLVMGVVGILFQAVLLQPLIGILGNQGLLIVSFVSGTIHNLLYGLARHKRTIYAALCFSQLTKTNVPLLAARASLSVHKEHQGQVQGALNAINALAAGLGPVLMQWIYSRTKHNKLIGPGTMFVAAAGLYLVGTMTVCLIPNVPQQQQEESSPDPSSEEDEEGEARVGLLNEDNAQQQLEEPLLPVSDRMERVSNAITTTV